MMEMREEGIERGGKRERREGREEGGEGIISE